MLLWAERIRQKDAEDVLIFLRHGKEEFLEVFDQISLDRIGKFHLLNFYSYHEVEKNWSFHFLDFFEAQVTLWIIYRKSQI